MQKLTSNVKIKISIFFFLVFLISANDIGIEIGIYDFTDEASKEFYKIAPALVFSYEIVKKTKLSFNLTSGIFFTVTSYNRSKHYLTMIPFHSSIIYNFKEPDLKFQPFIGGGFSIQVKFDLNPVFNQPHFSATYGYHMLAGIKVPVKERVKFFGKLKYNILIPPYLEDLNTSGIISTIGFKFMLKRKEQSSE